MFIATVHIRTKRLFLRYRSEFVCSLISKKSNMFEFLIASSIDSVKCKENYDERCAGARGRVKAVARSTISQTSRWEVRYPTLAIST